MRKTLLIYSVVLVVFAVGLLLTLEFGRHLQRPSSISSSTLTSPPQSPRTLWSVLDDNFHEPLSRLFLQLIAILTATRVIGSLFVKFGQPAVVGEMFAGVFLGPSLLGWLFPNGYNLIFPIASMGTLKLLSQIGVCLFMFVVGMELNVAHLRHKAHTAVVVSHVSILLPYFLGVALSLVLFSTLSGPGVSFISFALFMGISMSITAFPVLARILQERHLDKSPLGSTAIACAAVDDVTAWSILACVVAIVRTTGLMPTLLSLGLVLVFVAILLWIVRPRLPLWFAADAPSAAPPGKSVIALVLVFTFFSALTTEMIGIHALFGAFLAGIVMPANPEFRTYLKARLENFSSVFLLPLFFAFTGLRTQIGLINTTENWMLWLLITFVATFGKLGGSMFAARLTGMNWVDAFSLGALMNTRGLMELIAINIGYDLGILSPAIFAMLVLMALVTTFMTGPLLTLAEWLRTKGSTK